jgi:hypothetical protein
MSEGAQAAIRTELGAIFVSLEHIEREVRSR